MKYNLYIRCKLFYIIVIFGVWTCGLCDECDDADQRRMLDDFIPQLYLDYKKTLDSSGEDTVLFRRVLRDNKEYNIHIHKLKDVNGFKRHNLIVKEKSSDEPLIYVNNPVETKIPNAYITLERFKELLTGRVLRQRNEFKESHLKTTLKHVFASIKHVQHSTKRNNEEQYTTSSKKPTNNNNTAILKINKPEYVSEIIKHKEHNTAQTVKRSSQINLTSKLAYKLVPTGVIKETTRKVTTTSNNVVNSSTSTSKLIKDNSNKSVLHNAHHKLRINDETIGTDKVQHVVKNVTKQSAASKSTADAVFVYVTKKIPYQKTITRADLEIFSPTTLNLDTTKKFGSVNSINTKTSIEKHTSKDKHPAKPTNDPITTEHSSEESNKQSITTELTTQKQASKEPSTEEFTTKLTTKEPATGKLNTNYIFKEPSIIDITTEESTTPELTPRKPITTTTLLTTQESIGIPITVEQTTEDPITTEHITEEHTDDKLITEEPSTKEHISEESTTEEPTTEKPTSKEPTTEEPTTKKPIRTRRTRRPITTVKTTTKTKRSTLGRPMVFMGS